MDALLDLRGQEVFGQYVDRLHALDIMSMQWYELSMQHVSGCG